MSVETDLDAAYKMVPILVCKGLCQECCGPVVPSLTEDARIKERHGVEIDFDRETGTCTLLKDGKCSIYRDRPLLCRLWGNVEKMPCIFGCKPIGGYMSRADEVKVFGLAYSPEAVLQPLDGVLPIGE